MANVPSATTIRITGHLGRREIMLAFIGFNTAVPRTCPRASPQPAKIVQSAMGLAQILIAI
jgi:hypothetical protein